MTLPSLADVNQETGKWNLPDVTNRNGIAGDAANAYESSTKDAPSLAGSLKAAEDNDAEIEEVYYYLHSELLNLETSYMTLLTYLRYECSADTQNKYGEEVDLIGPIIAVLQYDLQSAYEEKTILDQREELENRILTALTNVLTLHTTILWYEEDASRRQANAEAYAADMAILQALRDELEAAITTIQEEYPGYSYTIKYEAILNEIEFEEEGAENEYQSVQEAGNYSYKVNSTLIRSMIEEMLKEAKDFTTGIETITVTEVNDGDRIFTLQGQQVANPAAGEVIIIVKADGSRKKVLVK